MTLARRIIDAATPYLGVATEDFLRRTCRTMVGKELDQLGADDVKSLSYWVQIGGKKLLREERLAQLVEAIYRTAQR